MLGIHITHYTGFDQIANRYWPNRQPVLMKLYTKKTSWRISQYRLVIWPIPAGDLANTGLAIWSIPVGDFVNTGWRFQNVGKKDMHNLFVCIVKFFNMGW